MEVSAMWYAYFNNVCHVDFPERWGRCDDVVFKRCGDISNTVMKIGGQMLGSAPLGSA